MIQFNELYITPDNKNLIIRAQVKNLEYYNNVYISEVVIDSKDTYIDNGPSDNTVYRYSVQGDSKSVYLNLDNIDLNLNEGLFFVYVITKGAPSSNTPCGMDNSVTVGAVINRYIAYKIIMSNIKDISNKCSIHRNFIDAILGLKAFDIAIETKHYIEAIKIYKKFIGASKYNISYNKCNCNG